MFTSPLVTTLLALASTTLAAPSTSLLIRRGIPISITPHATYSSSVGVLGCKIDINRVAYWPSAVDCNNLCVRVTLPSTGRSVTLLKIDSSTGANDISYDAYAYLLNGVGASSSPDLPAVVGGGIDAVYEFVDNEECRGLIKTEGGKLPFSAANSMGFVTACKQQDSWVGRNFELWNVADARCMWGEEVRCEYPDLKETNQPFCGEGHVLGIQTPLGGMEVKDVVYPV